MASPELDAFALSRSGDRLSQERNPKQAVVLYSRTLKTKSTFLHEYDLSKKYEYLACLLYSQRKYKQTMRKYKKAVQINKFSVCCYGRIGFCLLNLGELGQALESFKKALDISPDCAESYIGWALVLLLHGKEEEANDIFKKFKRAYFHKSKREAVLQDLQAEIKSANEIIVNSDNQDEIKLIQERVQGIQYMIKLIKNTF